MSVQVGDLRAAAAVPAKSFLSVPPFPGAKFDNFRIDYSNPGLTSEDLEKATDLLRARRVGGTYWAARPELPELEDSYVLVRSPANSKAWETVVEGLPLVIWNEHSPQPVAIGARIVVTGTCDPWHMLRGAKALICASIDHVATIAGVMGVAVFLSSSEGPRRVGAAQLLRALNTAIAGRYLNPFTDERMDFEEAVELCAFWRDLIDQNRGISGGLGFAFWKRDNVGALLWDGTNPFCFARSTSELSPQSAPIALWRSKVPDEQLDAIDAQGRRVIEVEDGFLRSQGLGADCVPPLSITVDRLGAYFDPSQPSELELLLQDGSFGPELLDRAKCLRTTVVTSGLSKYACGDGKIERPAGERRHILVPGQVEDDRSVVTGGYDVSTNLELLRRVRERGPDAYILYKPHPDVVAGHRKGAIPDHISLKLADEIVSEASITSLIAMVDEVHVNTSLAGFEALLRDRPVTTYGVPFYAGWGLTTDLGPVPARRSTSRTLDELIAATLLLYPRYLDPKSGLPCPAEVVVARLRAGKVSRDGLVVSMRRLQGKLTRSVRSLVA